MTHIIRVIDLETTGFAPPEHAPCEVAFCDLVTGILDLAGLPTGWNILAGRGFLCHPGREIPPESSAIHHLVDADVAGELPWRHALKLFAANPTGAINVYAAHSANFESQWVTTDLTNGAPWICTYKCALRLWPEAPGHSNQTLRYWRNPRGLDRAIASVAHRAYPDAYVTAHLLRDMLEETTLDQLIAWSNEPALLPKIRHGDLRGQPWSEADDGLLDWFLRKDFDEDVKFTVRHEIARREAARKEERMRDL
jgi:exodeoxyribonuclease X